MRVLVVDDSSLFRDLIRRFVEETGRVDELLLLLGESEGASHLARIAGHGRRMPRGHLVAQCERL